MYVQEICDPIFDSIKPPGFKKISFRKLQFGDAPIRIESVKMNRSRKEGVFLEMDFRWAGDPDIQLAIDSLGAYVPLLSSALDWNAGWQHNFIQLWDQCD